MVRGTMTSALIKYCYGPFGEKTSETIFVIVMLQKVVCGVLCYQTC